MSQSKKVLLLNLFEVADVFNFGDRAIIIDVPLSSIIGNCIVMPTINISSLSNIL